jgi:Flp pilus assembly protein TadG
MMPRVRTFTTRLHRDQRGAMMIETAIVAPVLILLSMGAFQVSEVIARQTELQGAAAEASAIALAAPPATDDQRTILKNVIVDSTGLDAEKVSITEKFRCGSATTYVSAASDCVDVKVASYVLIELNDTYTPAWTQWGFGDPINFNVDRYVMVKQS